MDNASYHNKATEEQPTTKWRKDQLMTWLRQKGVPVSDKANKNELNRSEQKCWELKVLDKTLVLPGSWACPKQYGNQEYAGDLDPQDYESSALATGPPWQLQAKFFLNCLGLVNRFPLKGLGTMVLHGISYHGAPRIRNTVRNTFGKRGYPVSVCDEDENETGDFNYISRDYIFQQCPGNQGERPVRLEGVTGEIRHHMSAQSITNSERIIWLFNDAVSTTRLFSVDEIGDSEMIFGEMRPRIRHRLPCIHITVGKNLGKNPTRSVRSSQNIAIVRQAFVRSPQRPARKHAAALQLSNRSLRRILQQDLNFHPYKMVMVHELKDCDMGNRLRFVKQFLEILSNNIVLLVLDEAHFHLSGGVNKQNFRYWAEENPKEINMRPLHIERVTVWQSSTLPLLTSVAGRCCSCDVRANQIARAWESEQLSRINVSTHQRSGVSAAVERDC
ncbi:hypothetical protein ANN_15208 [Periplaneta americana]|uniref:Uncharacterized protein n=1 Tax=Periplaneta americana TaxID=6978 RepID=A0ABQ8SGW9_PERAM|nr:hypothetical protein ANN_15208 [Periplaneta americana]